jgi:hypothetical protein
MKYLNWHYINLDKSQVHRVLVQNSKTKLHGAIAINCFDKRIGKHLGKCVLTFSRAAPLQNPQPPPPIPSHLPARRRSSCDACSWTVLSCSCNDSRPTRQVFELQQQRMEGSVQERLPSESLKLDEGALQ